MALARILASAVALVLLAFTILPATAQQAPPAPAPQSKESTGPQIHRITAIIKSISDGSLVVTEEHHALGKGAPQDLTLTLDPRGTVEKVTGKHKTQAITAKELAAGNRVVIHYVESDGKKTAKSVQVLAVRGSHPPSPTTSN